MVFEALPGTTSKLRPASGGEVFGVKEGSTYELWGYSDGDYTVYDPRDYVLTLVDGRELVIDQYDGLKQLTDLNGNQLTIDSNGVTHSSGKVIAFERDDQGRITAVVDPLGNRNVYAYDPEGNLVSFKDREGHETRFTYYPSIPHHLRDIIDPRGIRAVRNDYDEDGRLIATTDSRGKAITYQHDVAQRRETFVDRTGESRVMEYDERGNVTREVDAEGGVTLRTFDLNNNRLSETDPTNRTRSWTYDADDNVLTETDPAGKITTHTYGPYARLLTTTDPLGHTWTNTYDPAGNILTQAGPIPGDVTTFTYDSNGNLRTQKDALNHVTTHLHDRDGNLTTDIDALGRSTTYTYDSNGRRLTETTTRTTPSGVETLVTRHVYDDNDREIETESPDGSVRKMVYDEAGNVISETDPLERTTTSEYDGNGWLTKRTFPDGTYEQPGYDDEGRRTSMRDRAGRVTTFTFDKTGRPKRTTFVDGGYTERTYDLAGRVLTSFAGGVLTTYTYDAAGRQHKEIDANGNERVFTYDDAGRQVKVKDQRGFETSFVLDAKGRQTKVVFPGGAEKTTTYDLLDRRISETDEAGRTTQFGYDALGRLVTVTDALNQVTQYVYDERGNRTKRIDAASFETQYEYDELGRETKRVLPGGKFETKEYDLAGNLVARTDFMGRRTTYVHDSNDRALERHYPDTSVVSFTYSPTGQRLTAVDARGTTSYTYDNRDRLTRKTDPTGHWLDYGYDVHGRRTRLTLKVGATEKSTLYGYDARGMIQTVTDPDGRVFTLEYDPAGAMAKLVRPNGVDTTYTHDGRGWLSNIRTFRRATDETVASYAYTVANTGHRTRIDEADGTVRAYGYDALYRLTSETVTGGTGPQYAKTFAYDAVSSRTQQVTTGFGAATVDYTYDGRQRLLTENGVAYAWDDNGNQLGKAGGDVYEWDFDDRLVKVTKPDGTVLENTYDVDGVLVRTRVVPAGGGAAEVTELVVDTAGALSHVVGEVPASALGVLYVRAGDTLVGEIRGGIVGYHEAEGIGTVRGILDAAGAVNENARYTAFGEEVATPSVLSQPYRFAGERHVAAVGLYQNRARWLRAELGGFLSLDSIDPATNESVSGRPYAYSHGDAVNYVDPDGNYEVTVLGYTISVSVQGNIRSADATSRSRHVKQARDLARRLDVKSFKSFGPRAPGEQVHHLVERRFLNNNPVLRKVFGDEADTLAVRVTKAQHDILTSRWRAVFPRRGQFGHIPYRKIGPEDIIGAMKKVYFDQPEILRILLTDVSPKLLTLL